VAQKILACVCILNLPNLSSLPNLSNLPNGIFVAFIPSGLNLCCFYFIGMESFYPIPSG
jgi:hypothetical protein